MLGHIARVGGLIFSDEELAMIGLGHIHVQVDSAYNSVRSGPQGHTSAGPQSYVTSKRC